MIKLFNNSIENRIMIHNQIMMKVLIVMLLVALFSACSTKTESGAPNATEDRGTGMRITAQEAQGLPDSIVLVFFGDAMQHSAQLERARELGSQQNPYEFRNCFALIEPFVSRADYAVVNLELPLGGNGDYSGFPRFSAPDTYASALKDAGFDLLLTANNHCLDRGDKGARRTLAVLDTLGVDHIGTYTDGARRQTDVPFIKDLNGMKVGFLNYTYGTNGIAAREGAEVSRIDLGKMRTEVIATKNAGAEFIIVLPHWGNEYEMSEHSTQRAIADSLFNMGVDAVIGSHPHVVQPMYMREREEGRKTFVAYSLGNFISDMKINNTRGGALVKLVLERNENGKVTIRNAAYDLFVTEKPSDRGTNYRVIPSWKIDSLPQSQYQNWIQHEAAVNILFERKNVNIPRIKII